MGWEKYSKQKTKKILSADVYIAGLALMMVCLLVLEKLGVKTTIEELHIMLCLVLFAVTAGFITVINALERIEKILKKKEVD